MVAKSERSESQTVLMELITAKAEKEIGRRTPAEQVRIVTALSKPVPSRRCRPVKVLRRWGVVHFDVSETLRVSYRVVEGNACVVHVGTHPQFNEFTKKYRGELPGTLRVLSESKIMVIHSVEPDLNDKEASRPKATSNVQDDVQFLASALLETIEGAVTQQNRNAEEAISSAAELIHTEFAEQIAATRQAIDEQKEALRKVKREASKAVREFDDRLRLVQEEAAEIRNEAESRVEALPTRDELNSVQKALEQVRRDIGSARAQQGRADVRIESLDVIARSHRETLSTSTQQQVQRLTDVETRLADVETELHSQRAEIERLVSDSIEPLRETAQEAASQIQSVARQLDSLFTRLESLARGNSSLEDRIGQHENQLAQVEEQVRSQVQDSLRQQDRIQSQEELIRNQASQLKSQEVRLISVESLLATKMDTPSIVSSIRGWRDWLLGRAATDS